MPRKQLPGSKFWFTQKEGNRITLYKSANSCFPVLKGSKKKGEKMHVEQKAVDISVKKIAEIDQELEGLIQ